MANDSRCSRQERWVLGQWVAAALPKAYAELAARGIEPKRQLPIFGV